jgi:hypothetical protein
MVGAETARSVSAHRGGDANPPCSGGMVRGWLERFLAGIAGC